jgi:hypothetical protein
MNRTVRPEAVTSSGVAIPPSVPATTSPTTARATADHCTRRETPGSGPTMTKPEASNSTVNPSVTGGPWAGSPMSETPSS